MKFYKRFEINDNKNLNVYKTNDHNFVIQLNSFARACGYASYSTGSLIFKIIDNRKISLYTAKNRFNKNVRYCKVSDLELILKDLSVALNENRYFYFKDPEKCTLRYVTVSNLLQWVQNVLMKALANKEQPKTANNISSQPKDNNIEDIGKYSNAICEVFDVPKNQALSVAIQLKQIEINRDLSPLLKLLETV